MARKKVTIDGNEAAAYVAHKTNEVCAIYPITPSSNMGEWADEWSAMGRTNIWGTIPSVVEMQSEAGASATTHGALQAGALTTTFTAAQGLLLMIPTMFKVAGELTSTVWHVSARTVATHALSIFGDHGDVMAVRSTGFGLICTGSVQEVMDMALIAQASTLQARVPFIHFFDGFRTSHEVQKIEQLTDEDIKAMVTDDLVNAHRARAMTPDRPVLRGTSQNPDVFFQAREACNKYYDAAPAIVQAQMDKFAKIVGRSYHLFDYVGPADAERVIVVMGTGAEIVHETVDVLAKKGEKVGVVKVRLYRPFSMEHLVAALPKTVKAISVLDRTKEPGCAGEPMYQDVITALAEAQAAGKLPFAMPKVVGGRYGLSSKEFTPAMVKAVFDELKKPAPKNHFTVGINDDVTHTSLAVDYSFSTETDSVKRCLFYGLGSDGTVGANKNSIKIIGEEPRFYAQGYFVYDSKKAGAVTVSHLRFGPDVIRSSYLITEAQFLACHQWSFLERYDMLQYCQSGGVFLLNSVYGPDEVWDKLPQEVQKQIIDKKLRFFVIDAYKVAKETGMGARVNTIMQTCFFSISGVLPAEEAIAKIKKTIQKTYERKGPEVVQKNFKAVDQTVANLKQVNYPQKVSSNLKMPPIVAKEAPEFVHKVTAEIVAGRGDKLPVSAFPVDGTFPTDTARWEKRNIALEIPVWYPDLCIQCNKCTLVCPHASIRAKVFDAKHLEKKPATFKAVKYKGKEYGDVMYALQSAPEDCTGCNLCVEVCPATDKKDKTKKAIMMEPQIPLRAQERDNYAFFLDLPEVDRRLVKVDTVKGCQFLQPLFEYSGACAGCGETPYVKLLTQLFGDRAIIGNATGCSSIYGGNLPTTPYAQNKDGRGPAWNNSLFEDTAEFSLGFRVTIDKQNEYAKVLLKKLSGQLPGELVSGLMEANQADEKGIYEQRERVALLKQKLAGIADPDAKNLGGVADMLVKKSVWAVGGDGWAYDIGYGGLDHVLASGRNVNILVLDTEVYSNTGGQCSKATPTGAVAKFAAAGKPTPKKDLGMMAIAYRNCYVAKVAMGYSDIQTVRAMIEADAYDGPSIVIAYSHCIAHGIDMAKGMDNQVAAVDSGAWTLYRFNPDLYNKGEHPLKLDSKAPKMTYEQWAMTETRFRSLAQIMPDRARALMEQGQREAKARWKLYEALAVAGVDSPFAPPASDKLVS
ncbi:MAG: pyruvate:ferredoxin (flavodoxin) oxidoreductase [Polyangia bacterium]|jgi:pyruvate-ferredoxin/flavodoxin oxidoreductase